MLNTIFVNMLVKEVPHYKESCRVTSQKALYNIMEVTGRHDRGQFLFIVNIYVIKICKKHAIPALPVLKERKLPDI